MSANRFLSFALLFLLCTATSRAGTVDAKPLTIGESFTMDSKVLGETRRINVYMTHPYGEPEDTPLPVLYMPDGGIAEDFLHIAGLVQVSVGNGTMRPFLLVGIENTQRRRDLTGPTKNAEDKKIAPKVGESKAFRQFLRNELMPEIKRRYRTTGETAIVGESLAGLFVVETLLQEPDLFNTYIAFDPSLWWNDGELVKNAKKLLRKKTISGKTLYLATSEQKEISAITRELVTVVEKEASGRVFVHYQPMPEETHATIYHPAAIRAFREVFKPAPVPGIPH